MPRHLLLTTWLLLLLLPCVPVLADDEEDAEERIEAGEQDGKRPFTQKTHDIYITVVMAYT